MSAPAWEEQSLCRQTDPRLFMPDDYGRKTVQPACAICWRCPVLRVCLDDALDREAGLPQHMRSTIRGGKTPRERVAIDRRRGQKETA